MKRLRVLIYEPREAQKYASLIRNTCKNLVIDVCTTEKEVSQKISRANVIFAWRFPTEYIASAKNLLWIQSMGAGVEHYVSSPHIPPHIPICSVKGVFGPWMSEYIFGYLLYFLKDMRRIIENKKNRKWKPFVVNRLKGKILGIIGLGSIGKVIAQRAKNFEMEVYGLDITKQKPSFVDKLFSPDKLHPFLSMIDFLILVTPLTHATRGMIGIKELKSMKPSSYLINICRGPVVQEKALIRALREKWIAGAILDVFEREPLPPENELWNFENVIITPHISGPSIPEEIVQNFEENLERFREGKKFIGLVDRNRGY